jgi:F0F1-type ATP synthase membrane subunit b/b'
LGSSVPEETRERLQQDEAGLDRAIGEARREAATVIEAARRDAECIVVTARMEAEREAERIRASAGEGEDRERARAAVALAAELEDLARRASRNRERALERAVTTALAEEP